jgi:hypothetical protein
MGDALLFRHSVPAVKRSRQDRKKAADMRRIKRRKEGMRDLRPQKGID